ncbi:MAG TPA: ZIP family metal transporter [Steroidobacteraceae bacterium]|nr:ZIP family metal transporter [Steroidobacteraceae bacterium]
MPLLVWIILFTAVGGIASAAFAGLFLLVPEAAGRRLLPHFVSYATGALLGAALLALLPEAMEGVGPDGAHSIGAAMLVGLGVFFVIEKLVLWWHTHANGNGHAHSDSQDQAHGHDHGHAHGHDHDHAHGHDRGHAHGHDHGDAHGRDGDSGRAAASGVLVIIGDSIHNALDGVLIAAAFLTSFPLGLVTTFAVAAHEIPHRVGDFAILVHSGMSRGKALVMNMATGLTSIIGGVAAYFGLQRAIGALPYALALAAAGFLYIAVAGLIPGLHRRADPRTSLAQVILMGLGVGTIAWAESLAHQ